MFKFDGNAEWVHNSAPGIKSLDWMSFFSSSILSGGVRSSLTYLQAEGARLSWIASCQFLTWARGNPVGKVVEGFSSHRNMEYWLELGKILRKI